MTPRRVICVLFCLSLLATVLHQRTAGAHQTVRRPPNVLFLFSDDHRADTIGAYGNTLVQTPNLDRLARAGTLFTRATSPNPVCTASRVEVMTGCSSIRNARVLPPEATTWAQAMRAAGYLTCHVGKWHNNAWPGTHGYEECRGLYSGGGDPKAGLSVDWRGWPVTGYRGWVFQTEEGQKFPERGVGLTPNISALMADDAISLIASKPERPFFLHVNFSAPHDPLLMPPGYEGKYNPKQMPLPENFLPAHPFDYGNFNGRDEQLWPWPRTPDEVRKELACYYAVISHLDEQIGRIFQSLEATGQMANTLVIFSADQGLAIGSHGIRGKQNMYDHTIHAPLIIAGPGVPQGKQIDGQVYLRDIYPSICELSSVAVPSTVQAKSFVPLLDGRSAAIHPHVFCYFRDVERAIRTDRWKLAYYPEVNRYQLFDLVQDSLEMHDLAADPKHAGKLAELKSLLESEQRAANDPLSAKAG